MDTVVFERPGDFTFIPVLFLSPFTLQFRNTFDFFLVSEIVSQPPLDPRYVWNSVQSLRFDL